MRIDPMGAALFHTSMKAIGPVFGGPDDVLHGLMEYFEGGVMAFPALSFEICHQEKRVFDVEKTPSCIGLLPERFRLTPGVRRSIHPTHSVCAYGALAEAFLAGRNTAHRQKRSTRIATADHTPNAPPHASIPIW